jgi:hypothetical protein
MSSRIRLGTSTLSLLLTAALAMATVVPARAAVDAGVGAATDAPVASRQPAQQLPELGQIWVRGKKLARSITDSEDDFFRLYNRLNRNDDFDIECGYASLNRGSMIMSRTCVPSFLADALRWSGGFPGGFINATGTGGCDRATGSVYPVRDQFGGSYYTNAANYCTPDFVSPRSAAPQPPPALLLMARRDEYANNVLKVINSNTELLGKYYRLVGLYHEMDAVRSHYAEARRVRHRDVKPNPGPRVQQLR